ncbi:hypothetical protein VR46_44520, partial [Streptomyces sp. NRRL S-444]
MAEAEVVELEYDEGLGVLSGEADIRSAQASVHPSATSIASSAQTSPHQEGELMNGEVVTALVVIALGRGTTM